MGLSVHRTDWSMAPTGRWHRLVASLAVAARDGKKPRTYLMIGLSIDEISVSILKNLGYW
jgi:hypothetical protein